MITQLLTKDLFEFKVVDSDFREKVLQYFKFVCAVGATCDNSYWIEGYEEWGVIAIDETTKIMCTEFDARFKTAMSYFLRNILRYEDLDYIYTSTNPRGMDTIGFSRHSLNGIVSKDELCKTLNQNDIDASKIQEAANSIVNTREYARQERISGFGSLSHGCVKLLSILKEVYPELTYPEELIEYVHSMEERFLDSGDMRADMRTLMNNLK